MKFERNADGVRYVTTTMRHVRKFDVWQDSLEVSDDTLVYVHEDGTVSDAEGVEMIRIPSDEFAKIEDVWRKYWEFPW